MGGRLAVNGWPRGHSVTSPSRTSAPVLDTLWLHGVVSKYLPPKFTILHPGIAQIERETDRISDARGDFTYHRLQAEMLNHFLSMYRNLEFQLELAKRAAEQERRVVHTAVPVINEEIVVTVKGKTFDEKTGMWSLYLSNGTFIEVDRVSGAAIKAGEEVRIQQVPGDFVQNPAQA